MACLCRCHYVKLRATTIVIVKPYGCSPGLFGVTRSPVMFQATVASKFLWEQQCVLCIKLYALSSFV